VIALDSNILVYARRTEMAQHAEARRLLVELTEGEAPWAIPWPCIYEFLRVVTHPRIFSPPTDLDDALAYLDEIFASPSLTLLGEGPTHAAHLRFSVRSGEATGNLAHDAHIAALAVEHGVRELWTADRDFARFAGLKIRNPFEKPHLREPAAIYRTRSGARRGTGRPSRRAGARRRG
jgi:toxin-antitoxin system PIN domain toxin